VHDARIAELCIEHGVQKLWTVDRDFSRFVDLRVENPLRERCGLTGSNPPLANTVKVAAKPGEAPIRRERGAEPLGMSAERIIRREKFCLRQKGDSPYFLFGHPASPVRIPLSRTL